MRLKASLIGTGIICEQHAIGLRGSEHAALAAVCDLSPILAKFAARRFGAAGWYTDYRHVLDKARPDVVHVLTPPHTHERIVLDCLGAGAHVIVEKPIAPTHAGFLRLWEAAQSRGRRLVEDHNYRFNRTVQAIARLIVDGRLGAIEEVETRMALDLRAPGGRYADANLPHPSHRLPAAVLHEFITHLCYLTLRLMPDRHPKNFRCLHAFWSNHGGGELFRYDDLDATFLNGTTHGRVRFSSRTGPDTFSITVRGSRGYAETDLFQPYLRVVRPRRGGRQLAPIVNHVVNGASMVCSGTGNLYHKLVQRTPYEGLHALVPMIYAAIAEDGPMPVTFEDMDATSRLVDALVAQQGER